MCEAVVTFLAVRKKKAAGRSESLFENHCLQVVQSVLIDLNTYWIGFTECIATVI